MLTSCNSSVVLRQACPQLALACLTACVRQLERLSPDLLALVAFLSAQTHLRLNITGADQVQALVRTGVARAPAMTALSLTQFMFGAVACGGLKPAHMQVGSPPTLPPPFCCHCELTHLVVHPDCTMLLCCISCCWPYRTIMQLP